MQGGRHRDTESEPMKTRKACRQPLPNSKRRLALPAYYCGINGHPGTVQRGERSLAFAKKAVASLVVENKQCPKSWFGVEITKELFFQIKKRSETRGLYYAEIVEPNKDSDIIYTYIYCKLDELNRLLSAAWKAKTAGDIIAALNKKWKSMRAVNYAQPPPSEAGKAKWWRRKPANKDAVTIPPSWHHEVWRAMSSEKNDRAFISKFNRQFWKFLVKRCDTTNTQWHQCVFPWSKLSSMMSSSADNGVLFNIGIGKDAEAEQYDLKTAHPVFQSTCRWILKTDSIVPACGSYSALVTGRTANGHALQWFAPDFWRYAFDWRQAGITKVHVAGLALSLRRYDAPVIRIDSGPRLEEARARLRKEGKHKEASELKFVTLITSTLRMLNNTREGKAHAEFCGKIFRVKKNYVKTWERVPCYLLEVEVRPDQLKTGYVLPVYVFPAALEKGYIPKCGDLVHGFLWLQGRYYGAATEEQCQRFRENGNGVDPFAARLRKIFSEKRKLS